MLFSIVTVTLNNRKGLTRTAASISGQKCKDFEWLIIDGGSADGTIEDLKSYNATLISEPDQGIYDAMNKGIAIAKADYILFLNAGDYLAEPDILLKIQSAISYSRPDFIYGDSWEEIKGQLNYKPSRHHASASLGMFTHHQAMIYKRETLGKLRYDLNYTISADYDFTLRFLERTKNQLYLKIPFCIFESGGISQQKARLGRMEQLAIRHNQNILSPIRNRALYLLQAFNWELRIKFPKAYWKIKS